MMLRRRPLGAPGALLLAGAILCACGTARPTATPLATPTQEPLPSVSSPLEAIELTVTSDPLPPGRYTREAFSPRVTFELDGPWFAVQQLTGFFDMQQDVGSPDVIAVQFAKPDRAYGANGAGILVADAASATQAVAANEQLTVLETSDTLVGGINGHQLTVENATNGYVAVMHVSPGPLSIDTGRRLWIGFYDTDAGLLAVLVGGSVEKWQEALDAAEPVLESITIGQ